MKVNKNSTPLSVNKLSQNSASIERHSFRIVNLKLFDKYNVILAIAILTFIVSLTFWIFVTYMI